MQTIVFNCGYCSAKSQTGDVQYNGFVKETRHESLPIIILGVVCRRCSMISCLQCLNPNGGIAPNNANLDLTVHLQLVRQTPELSEPEAPSHVPIVVARAFIQAQKQVADPTMSESAAVMYRRTVEQALTEAAQQRSMSLSGSNLKQRIDQAAKADLIPNSLAEWAHDVRELGNEGAHGHSVEAKDLAELAGFVELMLRYLFTFPGQLAERRARRAGA